MLLTFTAQIAATTCPGAYKIDIWPGLARSLGLGLPDSINGVPVTMGRPEPSALVTVHVLSPTGGGPPKTSFVLNFPE